MRWLSAPCSASEPLRWTRNARTFLQGKQQPACSAAPMGKWSLWAWAGKPEPAPSMGCGFSSVQPGHEMRAEFPSQTKKKKPQCCCLDLTAF